MPKDDIVRRAQCQTPTQNHCQKPDVSLSSRSMEMQNPSALNYPPDLDEEKFCSLLQTVLDGIDRQCVEQLSSRTVNHPLIQERMGSEIAINWQILLVLIDYFGLSAAVNNTNHPSRRRQLIWVREKIFQMTAKKPEEQKLALANLLLAAKKILTFNNGISKENIINLLESQMKKTLQMPNEIQVRLLLAPVQSTISGMPKDEILSKIKGTIIGLNAEYANDDNELLAEAVEIEAALLTKWIKANLMI